MRQCLLLEIYCDQITRGKEDFFLCLNNTVGVMPYDVRDAKNHNLAQVKYGERQTYTLMIDNGMTPVDAISGGDTRFAIGSCSKVCSTSAYIYLIMSIWPM